MSHSSRSDEATSHSYVPFSFALENELLHNTDSNDISQQARNDLYSDFNHITRNIDTGISYLPIPEPRLQLVKPQQSSNIKQQIERDFYTRFEYLDENNVNSMFSNISEDDANRYLMCYRQLYHSVLQSILRTVDFDEEITRMNHSITYKREILPIFIHNHRQASREKKFLYNIVTKTWQKFDERIQTEINVQYQLEQIKTEHRHFLTMKIKQEQYQTFYLQLHDMKNETGNLKREVQQLYDSKVQLQREIHEIRTRCSNNLVHLDFLKSNTLRSQTHELNNLQLERDSLIIQSELMKYQLFEQIEQLDQILENHRISLTTFRSTLVDLEQQLKQQTDQQLNQLQLTKHFERRTLTDDTQKLTVILETKIDEKKFQNIQLQKSIDHFQEEISKQKRLLIKQRNDYQTMEHLDQQLAQNINIHRELYLQLKTERRSIDVQVKLKSKQYFNDDRRNQTLIQQHKSLLARKKLDQMRANSSNELVDTLTDGNDQLKASFEQLHRQCTQLNPRHLLELEQRIDYLRQNHRLFSQQKTTYERSTTNQQRIHEQLKIKNNRTASRMLTILIRIQQHQKAFQNNVEHIQILENKFDTEHDRCLQSKYLLTEMKNRLESLRTQQHSIEMQTQVSSNNIKHSQYRFQTFAEQLSICHNDLVEQQTSLNKLREYHFVLKEQDEINLKKLSTIHIRLVDLQSRNETSRNSLRQTNEALTESFEVRAILGRMVVRRVNLCQLLYRKLARLDKSISQRERNNQIVSKCIKSLKSQIRHARNEKQKFLQRKDKLQLEVVRCHTEKIRASSQDQQRLLMTQISQRRFHRKYSVDASPFEEMTYLKTKYYRLQGRLLKIICRGILCHFVLMSIGEEFSINLEHYTSESHRVNYSNLNSIRTDLRQLMQQLKAKTAETNMLIDYRCCFRIIHTDTIQQLTQWKNWDAGDEL